MNPSVNIELIRDYEQELREVGLRQTKCAQQYMEARRSYARLHYDVQFEIARVLTEYRAIKSNVGFEMCIQMKMRECQDSGDDKFLKVYQGYLIAEAEYKSYEKALEACQNESMGIMAIMRFLGQGERYSKES